MKLPAIRGMNGELSERLGRDVVRAELWPVSPGQRLELRLLSRGTAPFPIGVFVGTNGTLQDGEFIASYIKFLADPGETGGTAEVLIVETDGFVRFYNCWGRDGAICLQDVSGMILEDRDDGWARYSCNNVSSDPSFDDLVFNIRLVGT